LEKDKLNWTIKLSIIGFLLTIICILISGGGHGFMEPLYVIFPYSFLLGETFKDETWLFFLFMFVQFPIYGFIIDKWNTKTTLVLLILLHLITVVCVFLTKTRLE
jgi:hypothetical protein